MSGYQFDVKATGLAIGQTYQLLFRAAPPQYLEEALGIFHADANATFTITK